METREYTCIVCPKSCHGTLTVDGDTFKTENFGCKNGERYAINEYTDPKRVLTTTVTLNDGLFHLLPVVSDGEISRKVFKDCLDALYDISVDAPVSAGDVIVKNILDTGVDIVAARSIDKVR